MPSWLKALIGVVVIAGAVAALFIAKGGDLASSTPSSGDNPPRTDYSDNPGLKGLKIE